LPSAYRSSIAALPVALAMGLTMFVGSLTWQVPAAKASSAPLDAQASELVRVINGARVAAGHRALNVDTFLASVARDGAIPCPDDASKTIAGRAQDFAAYNAMSHLLRLCDAPSYALSTTAFVDVLQSHWGYGSVGEIEVVNGGYGNGAYLYAYSGWQTWTYSTTGHAMLGWQGSSSHWAIIMGAYDRVGCGGWANGSTYYYDCAFSSGGPNGVTAPPTASPFDLPLPTPIPKPTQPPAPRPVVTAAPVATHRATVSGGGSGGSGAGPTPTAGQTPTADPSPTPAPSSTADAALQARLIADAAATDRAGPAAALQVNPKGLDGPSGLAALAALVIALATAAGATVLGALSLLPSIRRRRRGTAG